MRKHGILVIDDHLLLSSVEKKLKILTLIRRSKFEFPVAKKSINIGILYTSQIGTFRVVKKEVHTIVINRHPMNQFYAKYTGLKKPKIKKQTSFSIDVFIISLNGCLGGGSARWKNT